MSRSAESEITLRDVLEGLNLVWSMETLINIAELHGVSKRKLRKAKKTIAWLREQLFEMAEIVRANESKR